MTQLDHKYSSLGLLTYQFQCKFKKVLLFLQIMDDPQLLFNITCFLDIQDVLPLLSTCKKLYSLNQNPIIQVRILKQKIKFLQSPKQTFNNLNLLPAYYQFLLHQKQEDKQIPKNSQLFFKNLNKFIKAKEMINKRKQTAIKSKSQVYKLLQSQRKYQGVVTQIQKQIQEGAKIYNSVQLSKQPVKNNTKQKSYVEKFRQEYAKVKEFQRKKNIKQLQSLHKKQSEKIRITKQIETPFKTIPVIQIKDNEKISVVNTSGSFPTTASRYLNRLKAIIGLNVYY